MRCRCNNCHRIKTTSQYYEGYTVSPAEHAGVGAVPAPAFAVPFDGEIGLAFVGNGSSGGKGYVNQNIVAQVMAEDEEKQRHARTVPAALLQPSDDTNV